MGAAILVVDDEEPVRALLVNVFEEDGYRVLEASNGREALAVLEGEAVDLVLSDVMMPGIDGYELCRQLKARPVTRRIPVILMSARVQWDGAEAGADATIAKPFVLDDLEALVRRCLPPPQTAPLR